MFLLNPSLYNFIINISENSLLFCFKFFSLLFGIEALGKIKWASLIIIKLLINYRKMKNNKSSKRPKLNK